MIENISAVGCTWGGVGRDRQQKGFWGIMGTSVILGWFHRCIHVTKLTKLYTLNMHGLSRYHLFLTKAKSMGFMGTRENVLSWRGN